VAMALGNSDIDDMNMDAGSILVTGVAERFMQSSCPKHRRSCRYFPWVDILSRPAFYQRERDIARDAYLGNLVRMSVAFSIARIPESVKLSEVFMAGAARQIVDS
jgi:hypothetical protein